jgi:hypothetical protein
MSRDLHLSDADYYFYRRERYTIQYILRYEGRINEERLRRALLLAAAALPPVGARLVETKDGRLALRPGHAIPLRTQCVDAKAAPADLVDPVTNVRLAPLVRLVFSRGPQGDALGVSFSHLLGDGKSFFLFLGTVAAYLRGEPLPRTNHERDRLNAPPGRRDKTGPARRELFAASGYVIPRPPEPPVGKRERYFFSGEELLARKAVAEERGLRVSENSLVMALLTKRLFREVPTYEGKFLVRCPVDYRDRLGLAPGYFGNAVLDAVAAFDPHHLKRLSVEVIANQIQNAVRGITPARVAAHLACLRSLREEEGPAVFESVGCPGLLVSNLSRMPLAAVDLGAGPPLALLPASVNPRLAVVLSAENGLVVELNRPGLAATQTPNAAAFNAR